MTTALVCLAMAVYFEARSEPLEGQFAVAEVVMNRVQDKRWPDTVCNVVKQKSQFSFYSDGKPETILEPNAYNIAEWVAELTLDGLNPNLVQGSNWYHRDDLSLSWTSKLKHHITIGRHIFWRDDE